MRSLLGVTASGTEELNLRRLLIKSTTEYLKKSEESIAFSTNFSFSIIILNFNPSSNPSSFKDKIRCGKCFGKTGRGDFLPRPMNFLEISYPLMIDRRSS